MVNGTLSRILYLSAAVLVGVCLVGIIALGLTDRPVPQELTGALTACTAFLFGAHVRPPVAAIYSPPRTGGQDENQ